MSSRTTARPFRVPAPLLILAAAVLTAAAAAAETDYEWPQFRGVHQDGAAAADGVFPAGGFGLEVVWQRPLGSGYSTISVAGERAVTMFTDGENDLLGAFDVATGKELWRYVIAPMYAGHSGSDDGPISTPVIVDKTVYGFGPRGQLFAVRLADGSEMWRRELDDGKTAKAPFYGFTTVPVVAGELLIVQTGAPDGHSITAVERASGKTRWTRGDDSVTYQSPALVELAGRRQLVAVTDHLLLGLDPASGEILWQHEHGTDKNEAFAQPLALGDGRILINSLSETAVFQVEAADDAYRVSELWRSSVLRGSYALPVYHQGHVYGFNSRFLTCVDAATGEPAWRSRPPGGRGLILVDGHLLIVGRDGDLVAVEASAEGYREKTRVKLFERDPYTTPSFAGGRIFVRDLETMAAVRITDRPAPPPPAPDPADDPDRLLGAFGDFVRKVEAAPAGERSAMVDRYLKDRSSPVVEEEGFAHVLYRGEAEDVAITGNLPGMTDELPLHHVAGTDLYFRSFRLDPKGQWAYQLTIDFGDPSPDPMNPHRFSNGRAELSELRMPGWRVPRHLDEPPPDHPRGRVERFTFASEIRGVEREIGVYLPPGYEESGERRYPLLIVNNGQLAPVLQIDRSLDNLIGESVEPLVVVFVPRGPGGEYGGEATTDYARMLVEELIPELERRYRLERDPARRGVMGIGSGGFASVYAAFAHPGTFGKLAAQSFYTRDDWGERIDRLIREAPRGELDVYLEWSTNDYRVPGTLDARAASQRLAETLRAKGYRPHTDEIVAAAGVASWRAQNDLILEALYPAGD